MDDVSNAVLVGDGNAVHGAFVIAQTINIDVHITSGKNANIANVTGVLGPGKCKIHKGVT